MNADADSTEDNAPCYSGCNERKNKQAEMTMRVLAQTTSVDISWAAPVAGTLSLGTHVDLQQIARNLERASTERLSKTTQLVPLAKELKQPQQELKAPVTAGMHAARLRHEKGTRCQKKQKR